MTAQTAAPVLRGIAVVIAVAAMIDPVFTVQRPHAPPLVLIDMSAEDDGAAEQQLRAIDPGLAVRAGGWRLPCSPGERCVVVADGSTSAEVPADLDQPLSLITARPGDGANAAIESAFTSFEQRGSAAGVARVAVRGQGLAGRRTRIEVLDTGAVIGAVDLEWRSDGVQTVDVPWWPIARGARVLRVAAAVEPGESAAFDNAIDLPVVVGGGTWRVLVFDARPSWGSTFVRRSLEDDPRFTVDHRARVAPALTAGTAGGTLDAATLEAVPLLIVGAPDALTPVDVDVIERFARVRGGSVILLPERRPSGSAARLFAGEWAEQLMAQPDTAGPLRATEWLRPRSLPFGSVMLAPAILATPTGDGRIIVSGAMDAWRHRDADAGAFDRFWTSLAAESAVLGEPLRIDVDTALATPGMRVPITVRYRSLSPVETINANATATCDRAETIRLWPAGGAGVFRGELPIGTSASCTVEVAVNDRVVTSAVAVAAAPLRAAASTLATFAAAARASGGAVTDKDNLDPIRALNSSLPRSLAATPAFPMRSALWLLPFVGCLSAEWWLRRRNGLR